MPDEKSEIITNPTLCDPFGGGRGTGRLLHDLGLMLSLLKPEMLEYPLLDFGAGSCWITEAVARMGLRVTAFDIHPHVGGCVAGRAKADRRVDASLIDSASGDGHNMSFAESSFGHLLCYDTLHHMHDYEKVFSEFGRVLKSGGRAVFVEPGAQHSKAPETIEFVNLKAHDPTWGLERDVILEEINDCAKHAGFGSLQIIPVQHPSAPVIFSLADWQNFRSGDATLRTSFSDMMAAINYDQRVVFYCDKV